MSLSPVLTSMSSSTSDETKEIKFSYVSEVSAFQQKDIPDTDEDFCLLTVENQDGQSSNQQPHPHPVSSPSPGVQNGCPCEVEECPETCCVETLRAMHRERAEKFNTQSKPLRRNSASSYGSMDSLTAGKPLLSPVASINYSREEEEGEEEIDDNSNEPLLPPSRSMVSNDKCS